MKNKRLLLLWEEVSSRKRINEFRSVALRGRHTDKYIP